MTAPLPAVVGPTKTAETPSGHAVTAPVTPVSAGQHVSSDRVTAVTGMVPRRHTRHAQVKGAREHLRPSPALLLPCSLDRPLGHPPRLRQACPETGENHTCRHCPCRERQGRERGSLRGAREFSLTVSLPLLPHLNCGRESREGREPPRNPPVKPPKTPFSRPPRRLPPHLRPPLQRSLSVPVRGPPLRTRPCPQLALKRGLGVDDHRTHHRSAREHRARTPHR